MGKPVEDAVSLRLADYKMKARESNIELLRIVLMAIIIVWHCFVYGESLLTNLTSSSTVFLTPLLVFPVDCFVFISGFFGIKLSREKLVSMIGMLVTYSVLIFIGVSLVNGNFSLKSFIISFFPVSTNYWWFFTVYIMLMIISPFLNVCDTWDKSYFQKMLLLTGVFYAGVFSLALGSKMGCIGDLPLFIFIYLAGRYLKRFPVKFLIKHRFFIIIALYIICCLFIVVFRADHSWIMKLISYNSPIVILIAIEIFYVFQGFKLGTIKSVNIVSSTVFASYIVTESCLRQWYISFVSTIWGGYLLSAVVTIVLICPIELLRRKLSDGLFRRIAAFSRRIL